MPRGRKPKLVPLGHRTKAELEARKGPGYAPAESIECPKSLPAAAKTLWRKLAPELQRVGALTDVSLAALEGACLAYARAKQADAAVKRDGLTVMTARGLTAHPAVRISDQCWMRYKAFCVEFGLTPASQGKVGAGKPDKAIDELEAALCA